MKRSSCHGRYVTGGPHGVAPRLPDAHGQTGDSTSLRLPLSTEKGPCLAAGPQFS
jgi:hypothetical protein